MKYLLITAAAFFILSWQQPTKTNKPYPVTLPLSNWQYIDNYLLKTENILSRTSNLPAAQIAAHNDTIELLRSIIGAQINEQIKSDTTHKK